MLHIHRYVEEHKVVYCQAETSLFSIYLITIRWKKTRVGRSQFCREKRVKSSAAVSSNTHPFFMCLSVNKSLNSCGGWEGWHNCAMSCIEARIFKVLRDTKWRLGLRFWRDLMAQQILRFQGGETFPSNFEHQNKVCSVFERNFSY